MCVYHTPSHSEMNHSWPRNGYYTVRMYYMVSLGILHMYPCTHLKYVHVYGVYMHSHTNVFSGDSCSLLLRTYLLCLRIAT